jgi:hypothetical protein
VGSNTAPTASASDVTDDYVPIRDSGAQCELRGFTRSINAEQPEIPLSVKSMSCKGPGSGKQKEVVLVSTKITNGMLPTKNFGNFRIDLGEEIMKDPVVSIRRDMLQTFKASLQQ